MQFIWLPSKFGETVLQCYIVGVDIAKAILKELHTLGLDMKYCRGQAYDGAANMSGEISGTATIICKDYPLATYTHCKSYCLNLALMKSCSSIV